MITPFQHLLPWGKIKQKNFLKKRKHTVWKSLLGSTPSADSRAAYGRITSKIKLFVSVASLPIGT